MTISVVSQGSVATRYYGAERQEMLAFFPHNVARVLDVGCGTGHFGHFLRRTISGVEVWGVEPVTEAHASAVRLLDYALLGFFNEALGLPHDPFDAVVSNDSLEHFQDHEPALALARRALKPGGAIVASISNIRYGPQLQQYLVEADWRYESAGILDCTRLRFFTGKSILREFEQAGYEVQKIQGIHRCWQGWKFRLLLRLLPKLTSDLPYQQFALRAIKPDRPQ